MSLVIVGTTKYVGFNGSIALQSKEEHLYKVCYLLSLDSNIAEYSPCTFLLARREIVSGNTHLSFCFLPLLLIT